MGDCTQRCRGPPPAPLMLLCQLAVVSSESLCFHAVKWGIILLLPCNVFVHVEVVLLLWILGMELIRKGVCVSDAALKGQKAVLNHLELSYRRFEPPDSGC